MKKLLMILMLAALGLTGCASRRLPEQAGQEEKPTESVVIVTESVEETEEPDADNEGTVTETERAGQEQTEKPSREEMLQRFYEQFYASTGEKEISWEEIENRVMERTAYYQASGYYEEIQDYWENTREVRDISNLIEPLYFTDMKYYTEEDFRKDPPTVIHLAKNEIYAKHGYIFRDEDLNNYFMGCAWYQPAVSGSEFDDAVLNDFERENLKLLSALDKRQLLPEVFPMELVFSSGAGAWGTYITLNRDGSFAGSYHDSEMGEQGEKYPNGSVYIAQFSGSFEQIEQGDSHTYTMRLKEVITEEEAGTEWIEEGIRYVCTEPFGLETGIEFCLYLPGKPIAELSEQFLSWWPGYYRMEEEGLKTLSCYGLYNKEPEYGFFSYE